MEIRQLHDKIVRAISEGKKDLRLIKNEEYQRDVTTRNWCDMMPVTRRTPICSLNRRRLLCNAYASYCDKYSYPFITDEQRREKFLEIINRHFLDL